MPIYTPPLRDQQFVLHEVLGAVDALRKMPRYAELDAEQLLPTNQSGDAEGCHYDGKSHAVRAPAGFKEAYAVFRDAGWPGLAADAEYGGQSLPHLLQIAFYEMQYSTNQAWAMYPGL